MRASAETNKAQEHGALAAAHPARALSLRDTPERAGRLSELFGATRGARGDRAMATRAGNTESPTS